LTHSGHQRWRYFVITRLVAALGVCSAGEISWLNSLIAQCRAAGVPLFVKQLGVKPMLLINGKPRPLDLGNRKSDPKGELSERWPPSLRVQQFPHISHNAPAQLDLGVA
jgi:hypothetical protein